MDNKLVRCQLSVVRGPLVRLLSKPPPAYARGISLYGKITSSPFKDFVAVRHPGQVPRPVRRSFSEDGSGTRAGIQNDFIFLDSPSTSLRVVSMPNHGSRPKLIGSPGMTALTNHDTVGQGRELNLSAFSYTLRRATDYLQLSSQNSIDIK